jgi:hypothetical protein
MEVFMKRLLTLGAAAAMALSLTACGDDKERTVVVNPGPAQPSSTTVVTPPANTNAAPPATQNNTVVVPERRP